MLSRLSLTLSRLLSPADSTTKSSDGSDLSASWLAQSPASLNKKSSSNNKMDWSKYPNFSEAEFRCKHCGKVNMDPDFLSRLQAVRTAYGKPLVVTSGYRCPEHPIEAKKPNPGAHSMGKAADVAVRGTDAYLVLKLAIEQGFTGIGINQKGPGRYLHLDTSTKAPRPNIWSY